MTISNPDDPTVDLTLCDQEPIHVPGNIQPHGIMLVAGAADLTVRQVAGPTENYLGRPAVACLETAVDDLLDVSAADIVEKLQRDGNSPTYWGVVHSASGRALDLEMHERGPLLCLELEPALAQRPSAADLLGTIEQATHQILDAGSLVGLCTRAAREVRRMTGFDRVMIYRFLGDGAGCVIAEDRDEALPSFLNHHYPASDIPKQARDLYLRNVIRVIPDVDYSPAPLVPAISPVTGEPFDMSDSVLRSVSPIHIQYLKNMEVAASMSVSIVRDDALWGLIACHNQTPKQVPFDLRAACRVLGAALSQQVEALDDANFFHQRARLSDLEEELLARLAHAPSVDTALESETNAIMTAVTADGLAICRAGRVVRAGCTPTDEQLGPLLRWVLSREGDDISSDALAQLFPPAAAYSAEASGLLAAVVSREEDYALLWFRTEQPQKVKWAGNPHKPVESADELGTLNPRKSFELWEETVFGKSGPWTDAEREFGRKLRNGITELRRSEMLRVLNRKLEEALAEREGLLAEKELLIREIDHRVQNSLQMVSGMLSLQIKSAEREARQTLQQAQQRLAAFSVVHRRLYRGDEVDTVDVARYVGELVSSLGADWREHIRIEATPLNISGDQAPKLGLILTELLINVAKYAYDGGAGPVHIVVTKTDTETLQLVVEDRGRGLDPARRGGFGTKLIIGFVEQLRGKVEWTDAAPGTRAVVALPLVALAHRSRRTGKP